MFRPSISTDTVSINDLLLEAFAPSQYEAQLRKLITSGDDYYEWVHLDDGMIVGHILYSPAMRDGQKIGYHLAPVSVHPDYRRMGIATKLINESLSSHVLIAQSVFVLGDPTFYEIFGFQPTETALCPFDEGNQHFRALRWDDTAPAFTIEYSSAFTHASEGIGEHSS